MLIRASFAELPWRQTAARSLLYHSIHFCAVLRLLWAVGWKHREPASRLCRDKGWAAAWRQRCSRRTSYWPIWPIICWRDSACRSLRKSGYAHLPCAPGRVSLRAAFRRCRTRWVPWTPSIEFLDRWQNLELTDWFHRSFVAAPSHSLLFCLSN